MKNIELLVQSLEYIEAHLDDDMRTEDIAEACHCSKSTLEKLFQNVNNISVHAYIVRRRMTLAAKKISSMTDVSIIDIAVEYGYSSHEAFTRAFREVWNCTPSDFRGRKYSELFPKLRRPIEEGDSYIMQRRNFDISELYDLFKERKDCYFICSDIKSLVPINEISFKAGDLAILESMKRLQDAAGEDDLVFRIGGDEFCILTNSSDSEYANKVRAEIESHNEEPIEYEGRKIPLSLYVAITRFQGDILKYNDLFSELHHALRESKQ